jgi:hypothetical protein
MVCSNRLESYLRGHYETPCITRHQFITFDVCLKTRYRSISYITSFALLAIDVRNGTSFLLKGQLEDAFSARAWTKSDIGPRCPDWACIANIRPKDRPQISGFWTKTHVPE